MDQYSCDVRIITCRFLVQIQYVTTMNLSIRSHFGQRFEFPLRAGRW